MPDTEKEVKKWGRYIFKVTISGFGNNAEEAWDDATQGFSQDPGPVPPDEFEFEPEEGV